MLGNPLPLAENPIRLAEELAMIDMISKGRLVSGFVRGGGQEQLATGVNPAFNRERFEEAHELIVKAWTQPGPFRLEGTHYQHRVVNPWAVPLQKPHPRVWIPGVISKETIIWAAQQRYPYIALNTSIEQTKKIWELYDQVALQSRLRRRAGESRLPVQRATSPRPRRRRSRTRGSSCGCRASSPASPIRCGARRRATSRRPTAAPSSSSPSGRAINPRGETSFEEQMADLQIIAGTPKTVVAKLRRILEETRPGIMALWGNDGNGEPGGHADLHPADGPGGLPGDARDRQELGLKSPFEANAPVHLRYSTDLKPTAQAAAE